MKPTKNRFMCPQAGKTKMLFASQEKALRFIAWNAQEIAQETGRCPIRSYYCVSCGGWHVTSKSVDEYRNMRMRNMSKYMKRIAMQCDDVQTGASDYMASDCRTRENELRRDSGRRAFCVLTSLIAKMQNLLLNGEYGHCQSKLEYAAEIYTSLPTDKRNSKQGREYRRILLDITDSLTAQLQEIVA